MEGGDETRDGWWEGSSWVLDHDSESQARRKERAEHEGNSHWLELRPVNCLLVDLNGHFPGAERRLWPDLDTKMTSLPSKCLLRGQEALRGFDGRILHPAKR